MEKMSRFPTQHLSTPITNTQSLPPDNDVVGSGVALTEGCEGSADIIDHNEVPRNSRKKKEKRIGTFRRFMNKVGLYKNKNDSSMVVNTE